MPAPPATNEPLSLERGWMGEPETSDCARADGLPPHRWAWATRVQATWWEGPPRPSHDVESRPGGRGSSPLHQASVEVGDLFPGQQVPSIRHRWASWDRTWASSIRPVGRVLGPVLEQPGSGAATLAPSGSGAVLVTIRL